MKLSEWISASGGRVSVAKRLKVTPATVHYWLHGVASPRVKTMTKIVKLSKGKVTLMEIIRETQPKKASR